MGLMPLNCVVHYTGVCVCVCVCVCVLTVVIVTRFMRHSLPSQTKTPVLKCLHDLGDS